MQPIEINRIRKLAQLFYEGASTPQEEAELRESLDRAFSGILPESLRTEWGMLRDILQVEVPDGLDGRLLSTIDSLARIEQTNDSSDRLPLSRPAIGWWRSSVWRWCVSVAAVVVMAVIFFPLADEINHRDTTRLTGHLMSVAESMPEALMSAEKGKTVNASDKTATPELVADSDMAADITTDRTDTCNSSVAVSRKSIARTHLSTKTEMLADNPQPGEVREVTDPAEAEMLLNRAFSRVYRNMALAQSCINNVTRPAADGTKNLDYIFQNEEQL